MAHPATSVRAARRAPTPVAPPAGDTLLIPVKLCNLPPFRPVAGKLLSLADDVTSDMKRVAAIAGGDPALAAEILFLANSSLFGFPARIQSLRHAVAVLGIDCIRQLAMTVAVRSLARGAGPFVRASWCHSVACAVMAEKIAPALGVTLEQGYTAGLLHDVGRLGFLRTYPTEIGPVLAAEYANAEEAIAAERAVMNASHAEAGAWLIEYWALPTAFSETCSHHHHALDASDSPLLKTVKLACQLADAAGYTAVRCTSRPGYDEVLQRAAEILDATAVLSEASMREEVETRLRALD